MSHGKLTGQITVKNLPGLYIGANTLRGSKEKRGPPFGVDAEKGSVPRICELQRVQRDRKSVSYQEA
jgi:hypothetical protein